MFPYGEYALPRTGNLILFHLLSPMVFVEKFSGAFSHAVHVKSLLSLNRRGKKLVLSKRG